MKPGIQLHLLGKALIRQSLRTTFLILTASAVVSAAWISAIVLAGGLANLNPGILLLPIVLIAFYFGPLAGFGVAALLAIAIGPWMPAGTGEPQPTADWVVRLVAYAAVGVVVGFLSLREHRSSRNEIARQKALLDATPEIIEQERIKALRDMSRGVAHDINNTLTPILGFSELLMEPPGSTRPETVENYARAIHTAGQNASEVVKRLREFYRSGDAALPMARVELDTMVRKTLIMTEARWKSQARAENAEIATQIDIPACLEVIGNEAELRGVLTNLIFNAVDAMPEGGTLRFSVERAGDRIALHVTDTGAGMDETTVQACTTAYFTTKQHGTGLGLPIVFAVMRYHGGTVEIASSPGNGTRVSLLFPVPHEEKLETLNQPKPIPSLAPLRILVAEDDALNRHMLRDVLAMRGHTVTTARDGPSALEVFESDPRGFDLLISDSAMPGISGRVVAGRIRELRPDIPMILLSGFDSEAAPFSDPSDRTTVLLDKPITLGELDRALVRASRDLPIAGQTDGAGQIG